MDKKKNPLEGVDYGWDGVEGVDAEGYDAEALDEEEGEEVEIKTFLTLFRPKGQFRRMSETASASAGDPFEGDPEGFVRDALCDVVPDTPALASVVTLGKAYAGFLRDHDAEDCREARVAYASTLRQDGLIKDAGDEGCLERLGVWFVGVTLLKEDGFSDAVSSEISKEAKEELEGWFGDRFGEENVIVPGVFLTYPSFKDARALRKAASQAFAGGKFKLPNQFKTQKTGGREITLIRAQVPVIVRDVIASPDFVVTMDDSGRLYADPLETEDADVSAFDGSFAQKALEASFPEGWNPSPDAFPVPEQYYELSEEAAMQEIQEQIESEGGTMNFA